MSGQDIYNVAKEFDDTLNITGIIMTKVDTDAHAGAVLSLISLLNKNIVFMGDGEKISNLDIFYPERIADRILGLGDIMTLAEKAKESIDENVVKKSFARMMSGKMDFEDLYNCMNQINNMGSMGSIMKMMPNMPKINESQLEGGENKMKV
jgi:signal recognition particle subunit SRP54